MAKPRGVPNDLESTAPAMVPLCESTGTLGWAVRVEMNRDVRVSALLHRMLGQLGGIEEFVAFVVQRLLDEECIGENRAERFKDQCICVHM